MNINEIIETIQKDSISIEESFQIAKLCSIKLRGDEEEGRKIIIHILDNLNKIPEETIEIWTDLIETAGFYPYLEKEKDKLKFNNLAGEIRKEYHFSDNLDNKYFHEEQKYLKEILDRKKNLIVSAPTSFGKSLLIEEIVANKKYNNIVIIQPTLALLDETRKKLKKYKNDYKIIVSTSQEPAIDKRNLFLLTAERVMDYQSLPVIDFLVIDEFYKLSAKRDDERSYILNNAFYKLLTEFNPQFYLLGPNIDGISEGFANKYKAIFYKTDYSLIDTKIIDIYSKHKDKFDKTRKCKEYKENILFELLLKQKDEQTIIYCSSPDRVRYLARKFCDFLIDKKTSKNEEFPLIEWIKQNIHPKWDLIDFLNYGIGINDGTLIKHINSSMIDYFNTQKLKYLFCTTTIIEGVNTSAKNVIFLDSKKGSRTLIDYFDYSNIKGRSGRMMIHYVGKIYNFNPPPEKQEKMIIDIPFFQQNPIEDEVLNGLKDEDIKPDVKKTEQFKKLEAIPKEERELFQKNGISVMGQKKIFDIVSQLDKQYVISRKKYKQEYKIYDLINWNKTPSYDQLQFILELCWNNLLKETESKKVRSINQLVYRTFNYGMEKNIFPLIEKDFNYNKELNQNKSDEQLLNESIYTIFNILRHWFHYKIPKWLSVINNLQKYICGKKKVEPGDYSYYASQIENDFVPNKLAILLEYGIPNSAILKLKGHINLKLDEGEIIETVIRLTKEHLDLLLQYEIEKIEGAL